MAAVLPVREDLRNESPYGAPQLDVPVRLNVNENPYSPAPEVIRDIAQRVADAAGGINRYPDRDFMGLRSDLAAYLAEESGVRLNPENIWAANGSNEIMLQLVQAFGGPGRSVVSFAPTYSMYPEYARNAFTHYIAADRAADFSLDIAAVKKTLAQHRPSMLFLASPNNPTGTALSQEDLREILTAAKNSGPEVPVSFRLSDATCAIDEFGEPMDLSDISSYDPDDVPYDVEVPSDTIVVVDEAYGEFRRDGVPSALELLEDFPNLVVSRTMSKAFGAAGLRLGYMAASSEIIEQIMLVRLPYHLSAITQAAARAALAHKDSLMAQVAQLRSSRDELAGALADDYGLDVVESDANFILFGKFSDRHAVWQSLLKEGVLIREVGPEGYLRVSVGTPEENRIFLSALRKAVQ